MINPFLNKYNPMDFFSIVDRVWKNEPISDAEVDVLFRWLLSEEGKTEFANWAQESAADETADIECDYADILQKVHSRIHSNQKSRRVSLLRRATRVAAVVIPLLFAAGVALYYADLPDPADNTIARVVSNPILRLPDGSEIVLDTVAGHSRIAQENDVDFVRENGALILEKQSNATATSGELKWGSVEIPKGAQFTMVLEDGTRVWLNADSRLKFPVKFTGDERRVVLEGEAYFAVAENKQKPFIVETSSQNITVLGTQFNVYAYANSLDESTTLVEGSVSLSSKTNAVSVVITPGQQAAISGNSDHYTVRNVTPQEIVAWCNGMFVFDGDTFGEVFRKLSRWYDFECTFVDEELADLTFCGNLRQTEDAQSIFRTIEAMGRIKIIVTGNTVKIKRK